MKSTPIMQLTAFHDRTLENRPRCLDCTLTSGRIVLKGLENWCCILERNWGTWKLWVGGGLSALQTWSATRWDQENRLFKSLLHEPCYCQNRPLGMEVQDDLLLMTAHRDPALHSGTLICICSTGKKKIISSSTLGRCFCRIRNLLFYTHLLLQYKQPR